MQYQSIPFLALVSLLVLSFSASQAESAGFTCKHLISEGSSQNKVYESLKLADAGALHYSLTYFRLVELPGQETTPEFKTVSSTLLCNIAQDDSLLVECSDGAKAFLRSKEIQEQKLIQVQEQVATQTDTRVEMSVETVGPFWPANPENVNINKLVFASGECKASADSNVISK